METKTIIIDTNIYSLREVLSTAYVFLNEYYIFLNQPEEGKIKIDIKPKEDSINMEKIEGEFNNELINVSLRVKVLEENRNVREMIINIALNGIEKKPEEECCQKIFLQNDPEGISKVWTEDAIKTHLAIERTKNNNFSKNFLREEDKNGN